MTTEEPKIIGNYETEAEAWEDLNKLKPLVGFLDLTVTERGNRYSIIIQRKGWDIEEPVYGMLEDLEFIFRYVHFFRVPWAEEPDRKFEAIKTAIDPVAFIESLPLIPVSCPFEGVFQTVFAGDLLEIHAENEGEFIGKLLLNIPSTAQIARILPWNEQHYKDLILDRFQNLFHFLGPFARTCRKCSHFDSADEEGNVGTCWVDYDNPDRTGRKISDPDTFCGSFEKA